MIGVRRNRLNFFDLQTRFKSTLTHVDEKGKAAMVDVGHKSNTDRTAVARGIVYVGGEITNLIKENQVKKGDVLTMAQIAGIMGAKQTPRLIPLCHDILLNHINVEAQLDEKSESVVITCTVKCNGKTGVEMEALTGVAVAALTVYDMCKAVTHKMIVKEILLVKKTGGYRGVYDIDDEAL